MLRIWYGGASRADRALALILAPVGLALSAVVAALARRRRTRIRRQPADASPAVVVVGNLVAGGAGKTPTVIALARGLAEQGHRVGLLARGYQRPDAPGATTVRVIHAAADSVTDPAADSVASSVAESVSGSVGNSAATAAAADLPGAEVVGDEPLLLARATGLPVAVGADRAAALALLLAQCPALTMVISDDGLQHSGLARAVELVIIDERGFGNGLCLPAGPLREPVDRLATVDAVLLHRRERLPEGAATPPAIHRLDTRIGSFATLDGQQRWLPADFVNWIGQQEGGAQPLPALAAIARPERFFDDLRALGLAIDPWPLPDHATIAPEVLAALAGRTVLVTAKDAVKLGTLSPGEGPRVIVAEQVGHLDPALLNWLSTRWPAPASP